MAEGEHLMKRRPAPPPEHRATPTVANVKPDDAVPQPNTADRHPGDDGSEDGPVILLSSAYSGAQRVQDLLAAGTGLACTTATGIIPLCLAAAESWRRVEGRQGPAMSQLAAASIRNLISAQVTTMLAGAGKKRWCELAMTDQSAAQQFLHLVPNAVFICVHRGCLDVIRAGVAASPWGLHGPRLVPYLLSYPGNSVAALAAYWTTCTEELLAFEQANPQITHRVRYEDTTGEPSEALAALRTWLRLHDDHGITFPERIDHTEPGDAPESEVPVEMIPPPLHQRVSHLHAELGYPPLPG
jgi:hypothetical protein